MGRKKTKLDKLSQDIIQCEKDGFGVHYGAWIAAQYEKNKGMIPAKPKGYKRTCLNCGVEFYIKENRVRKYCCDQCREEHYRVTRPSVKKPKVEKSKVEKPVVEIHKTCPICGKVFIPESHRNKYCSEFCSRVAHGRRVREYAARKAEGAKANG